MRITLCFRKIFLLNFKEIYTQLMNIAMNEDYGDFTDIQDGRDFIVEGTDDTVAGRKVVISIVSSKF